MTKHNIGFKPAMIRALLDGRKTQTRRIISKTNSLVDGTGHGIRRMWPDLDLTEAWVDKGPSPAGNSGPYLKAPRLSETTIHRIYPRWQRTDEIWIREPCRAEELPTGEDGVRYVADDEWISIKNSQRASDKWCDLNAYRDSRGARVPAIHMPRWASRITVEVIGIRPERVSDISEADAKAEGTPKLYRCLDWQPNEAIESFTKLWNSINEKRGFPFEETCWVWVIEFKVIKP